MAHWTTVPAPEPNDGELNEITLVGKKLWAVGSVFSGGDRLTLIANSPSDPQGAITGNAGAGGATVAWIGPVNGSTTTDPLGNYGVAALPAGSYIFVVTVGGCDPAVATVNIIAGRTIRQNFTLTCN